MKHETIAVLLRGLYIDKTRNPHFVICQKYEGNTLPQDVMKMEINTDECEEAASIIRKTYETWKNNHPSSDEKLPLPSCVALTTNGKPEVLFWVDSDFDAAQKRLTDKDDSASMPAAPIFEIASVRGPVINAAGRADVVRNKITLVTGGAQGIGEDIVRNLAACGALVFIADLNLEGAQKLAQQINTEEKRTAAIAVAVNVSSEESVEAMFNTVMQTAGGLDLCISNAGVLKAGSVLEQELADFKFVTDINFTGFFVVSKFAGRVLRTQHYTAPDWKTDIVQVNSKSGLEGSNKNGAYAGGKFGGLGLVASFAMELIEYGIKVNAVCPGNFLDGPLWSDPDRGLFVQYLRTGKVPGAKSLDDVRAFYEAKVPMKRGCTGKDLVRAIYYVVEQEYETGQAVPVTGGQIMLH